MLCNSFFHICALFLRSAALLIFLQYNNETLIIENDALFLLLGCLRTLIRRHCSCPWDSKSYGIKNAFYFCAILGNKISIRSILNFHWIEWFLGPFFKWNRMTARVIKSSSDTQRWWRFRRFPTKIGPLKLLIRRHQLLNNRAKISDLGLSQNMPRTQKLLDFLWRQFMQRERK